jgi:hypothetical protein
MNYKFMCRVIVTYIFLRIGAYPAAYLAAYMHKHTRTLAKVHTYITLH